MLSFGMASARASCGAASSDVYITADRRDCRWQRARKLVSALVDFYQGDLPESEAVLASVCTGCLYSAFNQCSIDGFFRAKMVWLWNGMLLCHSELHMCTYMGLHVCLFWA